MFYHYHPYKPFINLNTKKIIVGTLPPPRFCTNEYKENDVLFCYGSQDGLLWKCLDKIFDLNLIYDQSSKAVKQRKDFLEKNFIGICDIVESCNRKKIDASDLGMENVILRDILKYLKDYKKIETIIFTGGNSKNGPEYFFRQILKQNNIDFKNITNEIPREHQFKFEGRIIKTISLTSPSNAANRSIGANKYFKTKKKQNQNYSTFDFRVEQYKKVFFDMKSLNL